MELEVRHLDGLRADSSGATPRLSGHAVVTGVAADLGFAREVIAPEALQRALARQPDLRLLFDHDPARVLARTPKTLHVEQDERGLRFEAEPPGHEAGLVDSVLRGDITGASFAFSNAKDTWDETTTPPTRTLHDFTLHEISIVTFPAFATTDVVARRSLEQHRQTAALKETSVETASTVDLIPPVPPTVTETRDVEVVTEDRVLKPGDSMRSWVEARAPQAAKEYGNLRLGDVLRALITGPRNELERRALSEGTDSAGGYSVPDILMARWIDRLRNALVIVRAGAMTVPLTSDVVKIARLLADPTPAWRSENGAVSESDPTFEAVTFTPRSLDVFTKVSRELLEDSVNIAEMLEAAFTRAFAVEVDRVCLFGTGTPPQPRGLRTTTNVNEISQGTNGAALTSYDPVINLLEQLWLDNVTDVNTAIMAPRTLATIAKFKEATTNAPLARPSVLADWQFLQTANVSITETQGSASNASTLFMGDWSQMMLGFRTTMQVEVARELYRGNFQHGIFGHLRMDMQVTHPESFGRLIGIIP